MRQHNPERRASIAHVTFPYEEYAGSSSDEVHEVLKDAYGKMELSVVEFKGGNIEDNSKYIYAGL